MSLENTHYGAAAIDAMLKGCHSIFFIGIGGISMSSLAWITRGEGYCVGGSDRTPSPQTDRLLAGGIPVCFSHDAANLRGFDAVVYTVAIASDNPEYLAAKERGLPTLSRSDYLGYLMVRYCHRIGVAGMHGKTTCTAMCADILLSAADPTVLCGAELPSLGNETYCVGERREHFLFEACEYMDSFLDFNPTLAVVLNVGLDHVDYFHDMEQIRASFLSYARRTGPGGRVLYNADDPETVRALAPFEGEHITFALKGEADFTAANLSKREGALSFDFCHHGVALARIAIRAFGRHNLYNALAAAAAAYLCGIEPSAISRGLSDFRGARRRMEYKGRLRGAVVYEDYGHHPDEIRATLAGAREMGFSRILCAYQPHTYSRTAGLFREFCTSFSDCDRVYLCDIYAAREENIYGVSSEGLACEIGEKAEYCGDFRTTAEAITRDATDGDLVIIMGAGDIFHVFDHLSLSP